MRHLPIIPMLCALLTTAAHGQNNAGSADASLPWSMEVRAGLAYLSIPLTVEFRAHLSERNTLEIGARPLPLSLYAGSSYYPDPHLVFQLQTGYMKLSQPEGNDASVFESEFYTGLRFGVIVGDLSDSSNTWFSISIGAKGLLDIDYCSTCGFHNPVVQYGTEFSWTPFVEIGSGGWLL